MHSYIKEERELRMFSLFTDYDSTRSFPIQMPSAMDYILRTYRRDVEEVASYYRRGVRAVNHQHVLSRVIGTVGAPTHYPLTSYMNAVEARAAYVSKTFRFTSAIDYGTIHYGVFGAPDDPEIIINTENYFNYFDDYEADDKWKRIAAVRCLEHQNSCLVPHLLNGVRKNSSAGLRVYSVDIPLMMFQFYHFVKDQMTKRVDASSEGSVLDKTFFIAMYVLPNMIYSDMDLQMVNRFQNAVSDRPMDRSYYKLPIAISDYSDKVDAALKQVVHSLSNRRNNYEGYLRNIPTIFSEHAQAALQMPDIVPTRQVQWALIVSRLKQVRTLMEVGLSEGRKANVSLINEARLDLKRVIKEKQFTSVLDRHYSSMNFETVYEECMRDIRYIGAAN